MSAVCKAVLVPFLLALPRAALADEAGWKSLFDGKTLAGWKVAGGDWKVEEGAIAGTLGGDGKNAACRSEEAFSDFELYVDFKIDRSARAALLLRAAEGGKPYEIVLDGRGGGQVGAVAVGGTTLAEPSKDAPAPPPGKPAKEPPGSTAAKGPKDGKDAGAFRPDEWNRLYVRVLGKAPHVVVRLNARKMVDFTDAQARGSAEGPLVLQVSGGKDTEKGHGLRVRDARVRIAGKEPPLTGDVPDNDEEVVRLGAKIYFVVGPAGQVVEGSNEAKEVKVGSRIHLDCTPKDQYRRPTRAKGRPVWTYSDPSLLEIGGRSSYNPVVKVVKAGELTIFAEVDGVRSANVTVKLTE